MVLVSVLVMHGWDVYELASDDHDRVQSLLLHLFPSLVVHIHVHGGPGDAGKVENGNADVDVDADGGMVGVTVYVQVARTHRRRAQEVS